jgi:hypothetical protein
MKSLKRMHRTCLYEEFEDTRKSDGIKYCKSQQYFYFCACRCFQEEQYVIDLQTQVNLNLYLKIL